jgi:hypothetical protein
MVRIRIAVALSLSFLASAAPGAAQTLTLTAGAAPFLAAADLDLDDLEIAQDLGSNSGGDVTVDDVVFQEDPATCGQGSDGCENSFDNGDYDITLRGENFAAPAFEPAIDGSGGEQDDLEELLGGFRHRVQGADPPPASRLLEVEIGPLEGGSLYRLQLLFVDDAPYSQTRVWDITLDDGQSTVLVFDEFDIASVRGSFANDRGVVATIDFRSATLTTYTAKLGNPGHYNGGGDQDRTGILSAFTLERLSLFQDGFETGDPCIWDDRQGSTAC